MGIQLLMYLLFIFEGPPLPIARVTDFPPIKIVEYIGNFMYMSFAAAVLCGQIHFEGHWKGWVIEMARSKKSIEF
jgi:hypothetical protein